jgi:hypothetical protein
MAFNVSERDSESHRRPADVEVGWPLKMSGRADPSFTAPAEKFHPAFSHFNRSYSLQSRSLVRLPFTPAWEKAKRGNLHRLNLYSAGGDDQKWQRETLDLNFLYNPHARISNERSSCPEEGGQEKVFYAGGLCHGEGAIQEAPGQGVCRSRVVWKLRRDIRTRTIYSSRNNPVLSCKVSVALR